MCVNVRVRMMIAEVMSFTLKQQILQNAEVFAIVNVSGQMGPCTKKIYFKIIEKVPG